MGANVAGRFLFNSLEAVAKQAPDVLKVLDNPNPASIKSINSFLGKKGNEAVGEKLITAAKNKDYSYINTFKANADRSFVELHQGNKQSKLATPTDTELFEDKQVEALLANSKLDPEDLNFEGYETPDINKVNEYKRAEALSYIRTNHGTGNYLEIPSLTDPEQVKRYKFDYKNKKIVEGFDNPIKQYSWKDAGVKAKENTKLPLKRGGYARATTTTKKNIGTPAVKKPVDTIWHHSIPSQSTGKIYEAYMRHLNPKFKLTKNAPRNREFLRMLREVEEELGVKFGDDPLNARYLKDDPEHVLWHREIRNQGLDPKQIQAGLNGKTLNATEAREWLVNIAEASIRVDETMKFDRLMLTP